MLIQYEKAAMKFILTMFPELRKIAFAKDDNFLLSLDSKLNYPSAYFHREETDWVTSNTIHKVITEDGTSKKLFQIEQSYKGYIICEKQTEAWNFANSLRVAWNLNSYVYIPWKDEANPLPIGMRLLYIKVTETRNNFDKKGALRVVEFGWKSSLVMESALKQELLVTAIGLVVNNKDIIIYL